MNRHPSPLALLVLDDDAAFRDSLVVLLEREGFEAVGAPSLEAARSLVKKRTFDALLIDQELPDGNGLDLVHELAEGVPPEWIVVTGCATVSDAVAALKKGALDYLTKPLDPAQLTSTLTNLQRTRALKHEVAELRGKLRDRGRFGSLIGRSSAMQPVFDMVERVAPTDASVMIHGESGTGKEIVAQTIHELSRRADKPLVAVNCGAIPDNLIESELFGHERGSFTGADRQRKGFFERADGGTLFLDEIAEMPARSQVTLLRVLETGLVQRVGNPVPIPTNVRVLAATNREPRAAIEEGKLREDLYFRLSVFPVNLPPLRERTGDIELLAQHFLDLLNEAHGTARRWADGALAELARREWRGNVRELKNAVQRAFILADDVLTAEDVALQSKTITPEAGGALAIQVGCSIADSERQLICATLEHVRGDKRAAAAILGISLKTLYNRLNVYEASNT